MSPCPATHPEHGVPCEGEAAGHLGRHFSTYPYREWGEFVSAPVCGAPHASGYLCAKDAHAEEEGHSVNLGGCWLTWGPGREDKVSYPRWDAPTYGFPNREDNNAVCGVIGGRDEDTTPHFDREKYR